MSREADATRPSSPRGGRRAQLTIERRVGTVGAGVGSARRTHAVREALVVRLRSDGIVGLGEASPLPGYSRDSVDEAYADLEGVDAESLVAEGGSFDALRAHLDSLGLRSASARFAIETAALDFVGRSTGVPLHRLLASSHEGGFDGAGLGLAALVSMRTAEEARASARAHVERGYVALKAKVGLDVAAELESLRAVRAEVGPDVEIRLDANGAWAPDEVERRLASFGDVAPRFVEEPCALALLATIPHAWSVPVALDESMPSIPAERLEALLASGRVAAVVAKPALLGGFAAVRTLDALASSHGVPTIVSHLFDGPIALAAASELALALARPDDSRPRLAHGLAPHAGLAAYPALASIPYAGRVGSRLVFHDRPGLGLDRPPSEWPGPIP